MPLTRGHIKSSGAHINPGNFFSCGFSKVPYGSEKNSDIKVDILRLPEIDTLSRIESGRVFRHSKRLANQGRDYNSAVYPVGVDK